MKRFILTVRSACAGLLVAAICIGHAYAEPDQFFGMLLSLDTENSSIQLKDPRSGRFFTASLADDTAIVDGDQEIAPEDVVTGTPVIVEYSQDNDQYIVHRVVIRNDLLREESQ